MHFIDNLLTFLGVTNGSGRWYLWWSGIVGDIGLFGGGYLILRKHNCHVHRCWRLAWHPHPDHGHPVCKKHHPDHRHVHATGLRSAGSPSASAGDDPAPS